MSPDEQSEIEKHNSGRTGPISEIGRAISARNATRHGMCATTLIMDGEVEADWLDLILRYLMGRKPLQPEVTETMKDHPEKVDGGS